MLRDRLVCGINNEAIQRRLLSESKLTYEKALEMAQAMEAAMKNAQELQTGCSARAEAIHDGAPGAESADSPKPQG